MSAIPREYREYPTDDEVLMAFAHLPLRAVQDGGRFWVEIIGLTKPDALERGKEVVEPAEWLRRLHSIRTNLGEPALRVVRDTRDERHFGVAWTEEGRLWEKGLRTWGARARNAGYSHPPEMGA